MYQHAYLCFAFWFLFLERCNEKTRGEKETELSDWMVLLHTGQQAVQLLCIAYFYAIGHTAERITGIEGFQY